MVTAEHSPSTYKKSSGLSGPMLMAPTYQPAQRDSQSGTDESPTLDSPTGPQTGAMP